MSDLVSFCESAHGRATSLLNRLQSPLLLLIRLYWGWQFAQTGWGKLHHLDHVTEFFTSLNLPAPATTALMVGLIEFIGGILFAFGVGSRIVSLVLFVNMTVAYWTADHEALLGIISAPDKFYAADPYTFWFAALIILVFGPGAIAVDWFIAQRRGFARAPRAHIVMS